jgi:hypothetical protein
MSTNETELATIASKAGERIVAEAGEAMKDTRPPGYPGTLADWKRQCAKQARADAEVLRYLAARSQMKGEKP